MNKAKAAVSDFLSKDGKHDTTVHESVNPAITNENVKRTQHENAQTVVDRDVHQDHHHTSIQPIQHREVLPEQHTHQMGTVEHRNIQHGNDEHVKQRLANEQAQFKNTRSVGDTQHTSSAIPAVAGEHVHHHIHENIQPVVQKETVQPSVVHSTKPVHELHQNEPRHHNASHLPAVTMDEFQRQGGSLEGREERTDAFRGEPKSVGGSLGGAGAQGTTSLTGEDGATATRGGHASQRTGNNLGSTGTSGMTGSGAIGTSHHTGNNLGTTGTSTGLSGSGTTGTTGSSTTGTTGKPSLLDRLNPKKDADGDGKAGIMK